MLSVFNCTSLCHAGRRTSVYCRESLRCPCHPMLCPASPQCKLALLPPDRQVGRIWQQFSSLDEGRVQNVIEALPPAGLPLADGASLTLIVEAGWEPRTTRSIALTFRCGRLAGVSVGMPGMCGNVRPLWQQRQHWARFGTTPSSAETMCPAQSRMPQQRACVHSCHPPAAACSRLLMHPPAAACPHLLRPPSLPFARPSQRGWFPGGAAQPRPAKPAGLAHPPARVVEPAAAAGAEAGAAGLCLFSAGVIGLREPARVGREGLPVLMQVHFCPDIAAGCDKLGGLLCCSQLTCPALPRHPSPLPRRLQLSVRVPLVSRLPGTSSGQQRPRGINYMLTYLGEAGVWVLLYE